MIRWIALLTFLANFALPIRTVQAVYPTELTDVQAQYQFGGALRVQAHYAQPANLRQAMLILQGNNEAANTLALTISPDGTLSTQTQLADLTLAPFARVYYWVQFTFQDGSSQTSPAYWFDYTDNRFTWQTNESKWFTIHWVNGDPAYGSNLQTLALNGLKQATQVLPVSPTLPITIYVYPDSSTLPQSSIVEPGWVAAQAFPAENTIVVSTSTDLTSTQDLERQLPHEFTHLLEYQLTQTSYANAPAWLLEGLASRAENSANPDFTRTLQNAAAGNTLAPLSQLCHSFSPNSNEAILAYAQSASFVSYLINTYGEDKLTALLKSAGSGMDCQQTFSSVYGLSLDNADAAWKKSTFASKQAGDSILSYWPVLLLLGGLVAALIFVRRYALRKKEEKNGQQ